MTERVSDGRLEELRMRLDPNDPLRPCLDELKRWRELRHPFVEPETPIRKINKQCGLCGFTKDTAIHEVEQ